METITIPKRLLKEKDVVVIPRKEYEELLRIHKKHKGFYEELDKDLDKAIKSYKAGQFYGPFKTVQESKSFLASRKRKKK
ncbi:MAG TPA: hypothetical protein VFE94_03470 [Candidatus Paceibacterota bacterium]|nr:hypothetical protein [Candidatus Paceibacterota bacterium]